MKVTEFAVVIVRLFGLWLVFQCIGLIEQTVSTYLIPFGKGQQSYQHFIMATSIFNIILYLVVGVIMVWKPQVVTDRVVSPAAKETGSRITATSLILLSFSVAGLVFFVDGVKGLLQIVPARLYTPEYFSYASRPGELSILPPAFETAMGLWLLFGFKRIARSLHHAWLAGRTLGTTERERNGHDTEV